MKYTIELTEKEANQLNDIIIGLNTSWEYISAPKLKMDIPLPMKESPAYKQGFEDGKKAPKIEAVNIEDTNEYQAGYKTGYDIAQCNAQATKEEWGKAEYDRGYEDGKNEVIYNTELIPELKKCNYSSGYDKALEDASNLVACIDNIFIQEYFPVDYNNGLKFYDLNAKYGLVQIMEKWKQHLEKGKIKIGDEVSNEDVLRTIIVTNIHDDGDHFDGIDFDGTVYTCRYSKFWDKTGRHFEIIELLNQLRGDKGELTEESGQDTVNKFQDHSEQLQADSADDVTSSNEEGEQDSTKIKVGDIVEYYEGGSIFIVTLVDEDCLYGIDFEGDTYDGRNPDKWKKIGHSDELTQILSKLRADYWEG